MGQPHFWTPERVAELRRLYPILGPAGAARHFGVSRPSVYRAASRHGIRLPVRRPWTTREDELLEKVLARLSESMGRSAVSIAVRMQHCIAPRIDAAEPASLRNLRRRCNRGGRRCRREAE